MSSSEIVIRWAQAGDVEAIYSAIHELAIFERAESEHEVSKESLLRHGFGSNPSFESLVAESEEGIVGVAVFFSYYSTWKGPCIYLEDLIVTEKHRGKGIGKALLDKLIEIGKDRKVHSLRWQVLDWNVDALRFYNELGASSDGEWINCRLDL